MQIRQLKAETARLEGDASTLSKDIRTAQAQISQSTAKQQALALQRTLEQLENEKKQVLAEQQQLGNPSASVAVLEQIMRRETQSLEALRNRVRDMQTSVKELESRLSSLRSSGGTDMCVFSTPSNSCSSTAAHNSCAAE